MTNFRCVRILFSSLVFLVLLCHAGMAAAVGEEPRSGSDSSRAADPHPAPLPEAFSDASEFSSEMIAQVYTNPAFAMGVAPFVPFATNVVPSISGINPNSAQAGGPGFTLQVTGDNFDPGVVVRWNGSDRATQTLSTGFAEAMIPASDIAAAGNAQVTVHKAGVGTSNAVTFTILPPAGNPIPVLNQINPTSAAQGSTGVNINLTGSNFANNASGLWNGSPRQTVVFNSGSAQMIIPQSDLASPGTAMVSIFNPAPGGGTSASFPFQVVGTPSGGNPSLSSLDPAFVRAGRPAFLLRARGTNFVPGSMIRVNGMPRSTGFVNDTELTTVIPASLIQSPGNAGITVINPNGTVSNSLNLAIDPPLNPRPIITDFTPRARRRNANGFRLTIHGRDFVPTSVVEVNGQPRETSVDSSNSLTAVIPATDLNTAGEAQLRVVSPPPGGGTSNTVQFTVCGGPCIEDISPNAAIPGGGGFDLTIFGSNLGSGGTGGGGAGPGGFERVNSNAGANAVWNGNVTLPVLATGNSSVTVRVAGSLVETPGVASVQISSPGAGSSNSIPLPITFDRPIPLLLALSPPSSAPGGGGFDLNVGGKNFVPTSKLLWNGAERTTTVVNSTQLRAVIPSADVAGGGAATLAISNPTPGGGLSNFQTFAIQNALLYPRIVNNEGTSPENSEFTGLAVANLGNVDATLTFTAFGRDGVPVTGTGITNPVSVLLGGGRQLPVVASQIFGNGILNRTDLVWFKMESTLDKIVGFFLMFNSTLSFLDGADVSAKTSNIHVLPEVQVPGFTQLQIANPDTVEASVLIEIYKSDGTLRAPGSSKKLNPNGAIMEGLDTLFPGVTPDASDYIRIVSNRGVLAFAFLGRGRQFVQGLNGQNGEGGATRLFSPQYVVGGSDWWTSLSVVNLDSDSGMVTFRFLGDDGSQIGTTQVRPITGRGKILITDQNFFLNAGSTQRTGYVEITSNGVRLTGNVVFGDPARNRFSSSLPLESVLKSAVVFGQLASDDTYYTGLAVLNPNDNAISAVIDVLNENGQVIATTTQNIASKHRISRLLTQLMPVLVGQSRRLGYFRVTVTGGGVASFALFGTNNFEALSAVPPQTVP